MHKSCPKARKPLEKLPKTFEVMPKNNKKYIKSLKNVLTVLEVLVKNIKNQPKKTRKSQTASHEMASDPSIFEKNHLKPTRILSKIKKTRRRNLGTHAPAHKNEPPTPQFLVKKAWNPRACAQNIGTRPKTTRRNSEFQAPAREESPHSRPRAASPRPLARTHARHETKTKTKSKSISRFRGGCHKGELTPPTSDISYIYKST